jgi:hypothetical protein
LWLALACIVMRPRIKNDELKKTLDDAEKLSLLITTAMRTMNGEFDNKDLKGRSQWPSATSAVLTSATSRL